MTPTAKQQLEDLLNEALDEQRQIAIKKVKGIISSFSDRYDELVKKEFKLREFNRIELGKWNSNVDLMNWNKRQIEVMNSEETACRHVINLLKEELEKL